ncbi:hypothetical protein [Anoxybacteroides tepidamans]|uniref:hypothetical protein n=1 Tax=Anoxybacteroides tepidamans TaxID=265948 RepID=UPI0004869CC2|nr:hypothetical protein [Anoxybacillus tepidamans]
MQKRDSCTIEFCSEKVIALAHPFNRPKFAIAILFLIIGLSFPVAHSSADSPSPVGFVIEARQLEGTMSALSIATGDTAEKKNIPMLLFRFDNATAEGLTIRKIIETPAGMVTVHMSSSDPAVFRDLVLKASNAQIGEIYKPKNGNIGFKNLKVLAHYVAANNASLPQLQAYFENGGKTEMQPSTEGELKQMIDAITKNTLVNSIIKTPKADPSGNGNDETKPSGNLINTPASDIINNPFNNQAPIDDIIKHLPNSNDKSEPVGNVVNSLPATDDHAENSNLNTTSPSNDKTNLPFPVQEILQKIDRLKTE